MIEIQGVTHRFHARQALTDLSFVVPQGQVVGLVGLNGAGKTTLLRCAATLLAPTMGRIVVDGLSTMGRARSVRLRVGYLAERASPSLDLLAWEHLDVFARIAGHRGRERSRRVEAALEACGLARRRTELVRELSKGLRQRLALEAMLMHRPVALLLDEPTDGLDFESREQLLRRVRLLADRGAAVLLSSHVLGEIEQVADDIVILVEGRRHTRGREGAPHRKFRVRVRSDLERAEAVLRDHPTVADLERQQEALILTLAANQDDAGDTVRGLYMAGLVVTELVELREDLRSRFRSVLQEEGLLDEKEGSQAEEGDGC